MKKILLSILIVSLIVGCAPKGLPPNLTPIYTANEVLLRLQELQRTTISLHDSTPSRISKVDADRIVLFTVSCAEIIKASFNVSVTNWQQVVKASWIDLKKEYIPADPNLKIVWNFADAMIMSLSLANPVTSPQQLNTGSIPEKDK